MLSKNRLAADNDDLIVFGDGTGSAQHVFKLGTRHRLVCALAE